MLSAHMRMLFRLAASKVNPYSPMQMACISSLTVPYKPCQNRISPTSCKPSNEKLLGFYTMPRRYLAGGTQDDYILHQNSLNETEKKELEESVKKDYEDWVPYGFSLTDKEEDIYRYKLFLFTTLTLGVVVFLYFFYHMPPHNQREWVTREAYLEIERRQRLGLPLVDRNVVPAEQVVLPSLEELGDDYDIII